MLGPLNLAIVLGGSLGALVLGALHPASLAVEQLPWLLLYAGLFQPLVEESLFRGWLQGRLLERPELANARLGISGANLITSAAFVLLHLLYQPRLESALVVFPSLVYGHGRERYGGIALPVLQHACHNMALFVGFSL